ncbi:MAG: hypothetical protein ACK5Q5_16020 [Planctomycetaceae bacterium]
MLGQRTRVLLIATTAVCLVNFALVGRNRSQPTVSARNIKPGSAPQGTGVDIVPAGFSRFGAQHREQETTIRNRSGSPQFSAAQPRAVNAVDKDQVLKLVQTAIEKTSRRYLDVDQYTPWQIMHGVLALRGDYKLKQKGKTISGIDFISGGPTYRGDYWWERTSSGGRGHPYSVPYHFEGHINQFPALLSMSALPLDHQLVAKGGSITVGDIVRNAQRTVNTNEELTWTLWLLTQYINQDTTWVNQQGQNWSMAELVRQQVSASVNDAPCGGTHQLFALAFSRNAYLKQHGQLRGVWVNAEYKLRNHIDLARNLQNADGSFSSNWFKGRGYTADFKERIKTSGHMLEWLMMALPASRLDEPWVRRAIQSVANDLIRNATAPAECGPMYHACHALVLYRERVAPEMTPSTQEQIAAQPEAKKQPATPTSRPAAPVVAKPATAPTTVPPTPSVAAATPTPPAPRFQTNKPAQPGVVVLSPAAPSTTATTITEEPLVVTRPKPGAPGMLMPTDARPIAKGESAEKTAEAATPRQPLVLKPETPQPEPSPEVAQSVPVPPPAEATPSAIAMQPQTPSQTTAASTVPVADLPDEPTAQAEETVHPADLPSALLAHPQDLPQGEPALPSQIASADNPVHLDSPILPELSESEMPHEETPLAGALVIDPVDPSSGPNRSAKPVISEIPAPPTRISEAHLPGGPVVR